MTYAGMMIEGLIGACPALLAAVPDAWIIAAPIALGAFQAVQAVYMGILMRKSNRIDTLESRLDTRAQQLVDAKFQVQAAMMTATAKTLEAAIHAVESRQTQAEGDIRDLNAGMGLRFEQLKDFIRKECVTTSDLQKIESQLDGLDSLVRSHGRSE